MKWNVDARGLNIMTARHRRIHLTERALLEAYYALHDGIKQRAPIRGRKRPRRWRDDEKLMAFL